MMDPIELFNRQRFSTTEAAKILDLPLATFKTRLARGWLPVTDLEEGDRRRWTPDDLLRAKLTEELSRRGVHFPVARNIVIGSQPTWFGEKVFLVVTLDADGLPDPYLCTLATVSGIGGFLANHMRAASAVVLSINVIGTWLNGRLAAFYRDRDKS